MELAWWQNIQSFTSRMALSQPHHQLQCLCVCLINQSLQAKKDSCHVMTVQREMNGKLRTKKITVQRCMLMVMFWWPAASCNLLFCIPPP